MEVEERPLVLILCHCFIISSDISFAHLLFRVDETTAQVTDSQSEVAAAKRKCVQLEKQLGKMKVEQQGHSGSVHYSFFVVLVIPHLWYLLLTFRFMCALHIFVMNSDLMTYHFFDTNSSCSFKPSFIYSFIHSFIHCCSCTQ